MKAFIKTSWRYLIFIPIIALVVIGIFLNLPEKERDLFLLASDVKVNVGEKTEIQYEVSIEEAECNFSIADKTIALVNNSEILGVNSGETKLVITASFRNSMAVQEVNVIVIENENNKEEQGQEGNENKEETNPSEDMPAIETPQENESDKEEDSQISDDLISDDLISDDEGITNKPEDTTNKPIDDDKTDIDQPTEDTGNNDEESNVDVNNPMDEEESDNVDVDLPTEIPSEPEDDSKTEDSETDGEENSDSELADDSESIVGETDSIKISHFFEEITSLQLKEDGFEIVEIYAESELEFIVPSGVEIAPVGTIENSFKITGLEKGEYTIIIKAGESSKEFKIIVI